jgi:hypothetical protein
MLAQATAVDVAEGVAAYARYNHIMRTIAGRYGMALDRTVAVFVSLSPNSDYIGNLRSTVSVLAGVLQGWTVDQVQVSTYRHCLHRAWAYAHGQASFLDRTKGPKVRAFYHNVLDPTDDRHVTIDGHMTAIWRGRDLTMREALVYSRKEYNEISYAIKRLAFAYYMVPCEMQAVLWHTRKRLKQIKYTAQQNIWPHDEPDMLEPYPERRVGPEHIVQPAASRVQDLRRQQCTDMGNSEPGGLSGVHQASLAL